MRRRGKLRVALHCDLPLRYLARMRYDVEVHLKKTPRPEEHPQPRHRPTTSVVRYDYFGRVTSSPETRSRSETSDPSPYPLTPA